MLQPPKNKTVRLPFGNEEKTQKIIFDWVKKYHHQTKGIAERIKKYPLKLQVKIIKNLLRKNIKYLADGEVQRIFTPARLWADRKKGADCKSFTLFASSILYCLRIPHSLRIIDAGDGYWQHIYVANINNEKGLVIDGTVSYDFEPIYIKKKDININFK